MTATKTLSRSRTTRAATTSSAKKSRRPPVVGSSPGHFGLSRSVSKKTDCRNGRLVLQGKCRATAGEDSAIDPMTGMPLITSVLEGDETLNGTKWHYRYTEGEGEKPCIVLLHGVLSSSYTYRKVIDTLGKAGYPCIAPDWPGHGQSDVPPEGKFNYSVDDYTHGLSALLYKLGLKDQSFVLVTQGFILGQIGMLFALKNKDQVEKMVILNTPLEKKTQLPGVLKKLKGSDGGLFGGLFGGGDKGPVQEIQADKFCGLGGPYLMEANDAVVYQEPFMKQENRDSVAKLMETLDYEKLLEDVDTGYQRWRTDTLVAFGTSDRYLDWNTAGAWLEDKRTCMKLFAFPDLMGHFVQEDYAERVADTIMKFVADENYQVKGDLKKFD